MVVMTYLVSVGSKKIFTVIGVRLARGCSLGEAKALVDSLDAGGERVYLGNPCNEKALTEIRKSLGSRIVVEPIPTMWDWLGRM